MMNIILHDTSFIHVNSNRKKFSQLSHSIESTDRLAETIFLYINLKEQYSTYRHGEPNVYLEDCFIHNANGLILDEYNTTFTTATMNTLLCSYHYPQSNHEVYW